MGGKEIRKIRVPLDTLRDRISEALAITVKAYDLPGVCVRLGLKDGSGDDAFRSKRIYVKSRLLPLTEPDLVRIAQGVLKEFDAPELADVLSEITTHAEHRVTELTRREILKALNPLYPLFGDMNVFDGLALLSPPWTRPSESGRFLDAQRRCPAALHP
jgi:hypothetical protein